RLYEPRGPAALQEHLGGGEEVGLSRPVMRASVPTTSPERRQGRGLLAPGRVPRRVKGLGRRAELAAPAPFTPAPGASRAAPPLQRGPSPFAVNFRVKFPNWPKQESPLRQAVQALRNRPCHGRARGGRTPSWSSELRWRPPTRGAAGFPRGERRHVRLPGTP